ncbi:MAG TPA: hypothetical protein VG432_13945 [Gemmatimonadaceae bacterium]|nr:hypothetical protein [Gemmatimonadaceae bacterium]
MTESTIRSPNGARPPVAAPAAAATTERAPRLESPAPPRAAARPGSSPSHGALLVVAACAAVHLLAAALMYRTLVAELYALFDATPRLLVLERGLTRLTAVTVFLPPVIPTTLVVAAALWLGRRRRHVAVARWLALSLVPLAIDGILRTIGVMLAAPPANMGELLDLPVRFSPGPRLVLELIAVHPSPGLGYWVVVATVPAAISAYCVARALLAAEEAERETAGRRRRRQRGALDAVEVGVAVAGTWVALAFAGQVALPWAAQLFLKILG